MFRPYLLLLAVTGCRYEPPSGSPTDGTAVVDVTIEPDSLPNPDLCTNTTDSECLGNTLRRCNAVNQLPVDTPCAMCITDPNPHCETLVPSANAATTTDLAPDGLLVDITINNDTRASTDSGEIQGVRPGGEGVLNGIGFEIKNDIAVWRFHSLVIAGDIDFVGERAAVFAANRTIDVNAILDVRGQCDFQNAGPGGFRGGIGEQDGSGPGKGLKGNGVANAASGGAGGGHAVVGANGGTSATQVGPAGGVAYGDATITMLRGGSGGGGGGGDPTNAGVGGGGGGALQLVANDRIQFSANAGINAGGCGGERVLFQNAGGGGGGAGGTILLEASQIVLSNATLAVNGGAGSGGDDGAQSGENGQRSRDAATGGRGTGGQNNDSTGGRGGNGGNGSTPSGVQGSSGTSNLNAGGGGGGVGWIRINTRGDANLNGTCATCSPNFADANTTATHGTANIRVEP